MLVKSSDRSKICYIETKSLDGETNLKTKICDKLLSTKVKLQDISTLNTLVGKITCDDANDMLYKFEGAYYLDYHNKKIPINNDNIVLRGTRLKNTEFVIGIVVYTGHETKIMKNSKNAKFKMSRI